MAAAGERERETLGHVAKFGRRQAAIFHFYRGKVPREGDRGAERLYGEIYSLGGLNYRGVIVMRLVIAGCRVYNACESNECRIVEVDGEKLFTRCAFFLYLNLMIYVYCAI